MKRFKKILPSLFVPTLLLLAPASSMAAAAPTREACYNAISAQASGVNSFPAIMARVNSNDGGKAYLESGAKVYNQAILSIRQIPASTPVFVSSLPKKAPSSAKAKAAYKRQQAKEKKVRLAMAERAEENLQLQVRRAEEDVADTADERNLAIDRNGEVAAADLEIFRDCQEWNADATLITQTRSAEDTYKTAQETADQTYLNASRGAEDTYESDLGKQAADAEDRQEACRKDAGGEWQDDGSWDSKNEQIPANIIGGFRTNVQGALTDLGFQKVTVKKVKSNDFKLDAVVGSKPGPGSFVAPETPITLYVRSNKPKVKGLKKGQYVNASLDAPVIIAKKPKKPKGKPAPRKPTPPSADAIERCQDEEQGNPQYGSDIRSDGLGTTLDRALEDASITRNRTLNNASIEFDRTVENAERERNNPFAFVIPYAQAADQLDAMIDLQELRSDRQETEDERAVEDASLEARDYLKKAYGTDIRL